MFIVYPVYKRTIFLRPPYGESSNQFGNIDWLSKTLPGHSRIKVELNNGKGQWRHIKGMHRKSC